MKTEELNEYLFTKVVDEYAQIVRRRRIEAESKVLGDSNPSNDIWDSPLTDEDLKNGLELLEQRRHVVSLLLKEPRPAAY